MNVNIYQKIGQLIMSNLDLQSKILDKILKASDEINRYNRKSEPSWIFIPIRENVRVEKIKRILDRINNND
jgi:hypothetical protein